MKTINKKFFTFQNKSFQPAFLETSSNEHGLLIPAFDTEIQNVNLILPFNKSLFEQQKDDKIHYGFQYWLGVGLMVLIAGTVMLGAIIGAIYGINFVDVVFHTLH